MEGNNELHLCPAEMIRAVEYYLNNVQFKEPVKVNTIGMDRSNNSFVVYIRKMEELKKAEEVETVEPSSNF